MMHRVLPDKFMKNRRLKKAVRKSRAWTQYYEALQTDKHPPWIKGQEAQAIKYRSVIFKFEITEPLYLFPSRPLKDLLV
jgi:hypothetical protein